MREPAAEVVLVDEDDNPLGTAPKATVHSTDTPLHRAFSCHVLSPSHRVLVTRRSLSKLTWPGVWSNSFCGHPRPGETYEAAVARHAETELGLTLESLRVELPRFRYRAVDASGTMENEWCPVFLAVAERPARPNPDEVMGLRWEAPSNIAAALQAAPWAFSPWLVDQAAQMRLYSRLAGSTSSGDARD